MASIRPDFDLLYCPVAVECSRDTPRPRCGSSTNSITRFLLQHKGQCLLDLTCVVNSDQQKAEGPASKMSLSGEREEGGTVSKMSLSGEREEGGTASKMSLSGEREEGGTASKMSLSGEREEGGTASKMSLSGEHDMDTKAKSPIQQERPASPVPSCVSMKSDRSMDKPITFRDKDITTEQRMRQQRPASPVPSYVSMKSDWSMGPPINFSDGGPSNEEGKRSRAVLAEDQSRCALCEQVLRDPVSPPCGHRVCRACISSSWQQPGPSADHTCPQCGKRPRTQPGLLPPGQQHIQRNTDTIVSGLQRVLGTHKATMKRRFEHVAEGIMATGNAILLTSIYTELYITEGDSEGVNNEHEVWQLETASRVQITHDTPIHCNDIFQLLAGQERLIRTVLTKGIAGIGKTVSAQKVILDWAEGKANHEVDVMFVLPFRELNLIKDVRYSLLQLLRDFHPELHMDDGEILAVSKAMFIFDGLDESRLPLDFRRNQSWCDVTESTSVDVLLTNLIKGNLLPSALIWITTRPAAANQIPSECVDLVTEVRGFNDAQKEEYIMKRCSDETLARRIISHIKASRTLYIMCHIPVFSSMCVTVLEHMLRTDSTGEMPQTLTEMYTHFLLIQTKMKNQKYQEGNGTDEEELLRSDQDVLLKLGKLAFEHLEKGNLLFYQEDLEECGLHVQEASVYSGVCTAIFKEDAVLFQRVVYCFVHLSIQEFLSAVYTLHCYATNNMEALRPFLRRKTKAGPENLSLEELLKGAVDKALQSKNGHLDLFVRFLHGLSLESNQKLLRGLLAQTQRSPESLKKTIRSLKVTQKKNISPERYINLFHCLMEMKDHSAQQEIQAYLKKKSSKSLSLAHCSALAYMLLMSEEVLDEFDPQKYKTSEEGRRRLLPAVKICRKAVLSRCKLTDASWEVVSSALTSNPSHLRELDLRDSGLQDREVKLLSAALENPNCKLEILWLPALHLTEEGCASLASALKTNPSLLRDLDLSNSDLKDSGMKLLSAVLEDPLCKLDTLRLSGCHITEEGCASLGSVLKSTSFLRQLDLSNNDLKDAGMKLLSAGLGNPLCKLETLRLSCCGVTEEGCAFLASALKTNPSLLRDLDLSKSDLKKSDMKLLSAVLGNPLCKLETLRLSGCHIAEEGCASLASALKTNHPLLRDLDLSNSNLKDSDMKLLSAVLEDPLCKLETLRLSCCGVTEEGCASLASALRSNPSTLRKLYLRNNDLQIPEMQLLSDLQWNPLCKLKTLRVSSCNITEKACASLASALKSKPSFPRELDLSNKDLRKSDMKLLSAVLRSPLWKLETLRLSGCHITEEGCASLGSVLKSTSFLRQLDLSNNDLKDAGMKLLSAGLGNPLCKLETLRLSGCLVTEEGCASLASALRSNPFHLRELDLSYNHPGEKGLELLSAGLEDPHCRLEKLNVDHGGECWIKPGLRKYACELTLDPNTACRLLSLSEENRKVTWRREEQPYPDHPERFDYCSQVLCREGLSGRCYWEAERSGSWVYIAVTYKGISRRGWGADCGLGSNNKSWSLDCDGNSYYASHNNKITVIPDPPSSSHRVGVYLDWLAGTLSFYTVSSDTLTHLHTFHSTFTEPLYPGFRVFDFDSSVSLCQVE
ncbi:NACHT, LRR and PYD domains-containing protein 12-like isoform X7 [Osmerus mordax]|uniref:NACHT, LRR and PYD domains-containing protein 12-like isoform X7 n=1 Tax=Osmerus mordax TaxID=8014 RepID=UPI00350F0D76